MSFARGADAQRYPGQRLLRTSGTSASQRHRWIMPSRRMVAPQRRGVGGRGRVGAPPVEALQELQPSRRGMIHRLRSLGSLAVGEAVDHVDGRR